MLAWRVFRCAAHATLKYFRATSIGAYKVAAALMKTPGWSDGKAAILGLRWRLQAWGEVYEGQRDYVLKCFSDEARGDKYRECAAVSNPPQKVSSFDAIV